MRYSPESLDAFVEAARLGSFSAAARHLGKTQSTISAAINNLEIDLGIPLFERSKRYPELTHQGLQALAYAKEILAADDRLRQLSVQASQGVEARVTLVFSDVFQPDPEWQLLHQFAERFPHTELEWLDAEGDDVMDYILSGRAQLGLMSRREDYPHEIAIEPLSHHSELAPFASHVHPLAQEVGLQRASLAHYRRIRISDSGRGQRSGPGWAASDYIAVLEMVMAGLGWAELPRQLVSLYGKGELVELTVPGWPKRLQSDAIRLRSTPLGPAALWWLEAFRGLKGS